MQSLPKARGLLFLPLGMGTSAETQGKDVWRVSGRKSSEVPSQGTLPERGPSFCSLEVTLRRRQDCLGVRLGWGGEETASLEHPGWDFPQHLIHSFIHSFEAHSDCISSLPPSLLQFPSLRTHSVSPQPLSPGVDCLVGMWPVNRYNGESV